MSNQQYITVFYWVRTSQWFLHKVVIGITHNAIPAMHDLQYGGQ